MKNTRSIWRGWFGRAARLAVVALGLVAIEAATAAAQEACRVYSRASYSGFTASMGDGDAIGRFGFFLDKEITSVAVADGCRVRLYSGKNLSGDELVVRDSTTKLERAWDNRPRSAACECGRRGRGGGRRDDRADDDRGFRDEDEGDRFGRDFDGRATGDGNPPELSRRAAACIVFEDRRFRGRWRSFARGDVDKRIGRRLRQRVSSVQVAQGCRAVVEFDRPYRLIIDGPVRRLPAAVEDRAVSVTCRCGR